MAVGLKLLMEVGIVSVWVCVGVSGWVCEWVGVWVSGCVGVWLNAVTQNVQEN